MKKFQHLRQNKKVSKHSTKKSQIPSYNKRTRKLLGVLLPAIPEVKQMLLDIRKEFDLPIINTGDKLEDLISPEQKINWAAIHKKLEKRIREIPDLLPPELAKFKRIADFRKELPRKVKFTEPATPKLRLDVRKLYKSFLQLYDFTLTNLAKSVKDAADSFITAAADNLVEFLKTGEAKEVPNDWINVVRTLSMFDEKVVVVMASQAANPDDTAEEFRQEYSKAFGKRKRKVTTTDIDLADYLRMKFEGMALKDIADEYIQRNRADFPDDPESEEYREKKEILEDNLKHNFRSARDRIDAILGD
jgi:hypothetical protein